MRIWYFHYARPGWHERNNYLWKEVAKSWKGHDFQVVNLAERGTAKKLERSGQYADVAYITNFQSSDVLTGSPLDVTKKARLRLFITGGGWRRPEWVSRSVKACGEIKADLVCLTHRPHEDRFRKAHKNVHYVGLGFDPGIFYPAPAKAKFNWLVFCGNPAMGRRKNLEKMFHDLPGMVDFRQGLTHTQMGAYIRYARVGWNQIGRMETVSCNLRVYEVLGSETLLFCNRSQHVPFVDGQHYIAWDNPNDMIAKAQHWLDDKHQDEREEIARAGYKEVLANHTWAHRAQEYKALIEKYL